MNPRPTVTYDFLRIAGRPALPGAAAMVRSSGGSCMYVGRRMTPNPVTASPDTTYTRAYQLMHENGIRHLPIMENGRLVGIVVENDLLKAQPSSATTLSVYEISSLLDNLKLRDIMSSPVYTVEDNCPLEEAAAILIDKKITGLPVMRGDELVGIITEVDIFRSFVEVLGGTREGLTFVVRLEDKPGALASVADAVAKAGGNILSLVTFGPDQRGGGEIYIKQVGADREQIEKLISDEALADLLWIGKTEQQKPRLFGKKK
jgi:acetoin utilization protein AcuB